MSIGANASDWDRVLSRGSEAARAAFSRWVRSSPKNLQLYLMETVLRVELQGLDSGREFDLDALLARAPHPAHSDPSPIGRRRSPSR